MLIGPFHHHQDIKMLLILSYWSTQWLSTSAQPSSSTLHLKRCRFDSYRYRFCSVRPITSIFTARQQSCGKVMFSQMSVILFGRGGGGRSHQMHYRIGRMLGYPIPRERSGRIPPPLPWTSDLGTPASDIWW